MKTAIRHLDQRFQALKPLKAADRPPKGWVRAIRNALGMTSAQLAKRLNVAQPRVLEIEQAELSGSLTIKSLERAAEALGCRVVYALVPETTLADALERQAALAAERQLIFVNQTMSLEDQAVSNKLYFKEKRADLIKELLKKPARIWDEK